MVTKKLVHDLDVCFKRLLVKPSMVHIRETQMLMVALTGRFVVALTGPCGCDMPGLKPLLAYSRFMVAVLPGAEALGGLSRGTDRPYFGGALPGT